MFLPNARGTAPGLRLKVGGAWVFALPGVPQEMLPMLEEQVIPFLVAAGGRRRGAGEPAHPLLGGVRVGHRRAPGRPLRVVAPTPRWPSWPAAGRSRCASPPGRPSAEEAAALLDPVEAEVRRRLEPLGVRGRRRDHRAHRPAPVPGAGVDAGHRRVGHRRHGGGAADLGAGGLGGVRGGGGGLHPGPEDRRCWGCPPRSWRKRASSAR